MKLRYTLRAATELEEAVVTGTRSSYRASEYSFLIVWKGLSRRFWKIQGISHVLMVSFVATLSNVFHFPYIILLKMILLLFMPYSTIGATPKTCPEA
tara:strand:+ start:116 stop:406 length:291 start_codon:yes stop_codon:yes gene_type:complete